MPPSNQTANISSNQTNTAPPSSMNLSANSSTQPQGLVFGNGEYSVVLDDVSLVQSMPCGLFSIRRTNDSAVLDKMAICTFQSGFWVSPEGHKFRIRADKVAAGYANQTMWAQVEIFG